MALYLITDSAIGDYDRSLLVVCDTPEQATEHWAAYYEIDPDDYEPGDTEGTPERVFLVTAPDTPGPVGWHTDALKQVGGHLDD